MTATPTAIPPLPAPQSVWGGPYLPREMEAFAHAAVEADRESGSRVVAAQVGWQPIPADMVLVPREPTEAMWAAGRDPVMHRDLGHKPAIFPSHPEPVCAWQLNPTTREPELDTSKGTTAVHVWRAMIAAAPAQPTGEQA